MADFNVPTARRFGFDVGMTRTVDRQDEFNTGCVADLRWQIGEDLLHHDGVTREIPWEMKVSGLRARLSGADRLGDHPTPKNWHRWACQPGSVVPSRRPT